MVIRRLRALGLVANRTYCDRDGARGERGARRAQATIDDELVLSPRAKLASYLRTQLRVGHPTAKVEGLEAQAEGQSGAAVSRRY
jgi:hypothetical protein